MQNAPFLCPGIPINWPTGLLICEQETISHFLVFERLAFHLKAPQHGAPAVNKSLALEKSGWKWYEAGLLARFFVTIEAERHIYAPGLAAGY